MEEEKKVHETNKRRYENQKYYMEHALERIDELLSGAKQEITHNEEGYREPEHYLYFACRKVFQYQGISPQEPPYLRSGRTSTQPFEDILNVNQIEKRDITLKGAWYRETSTPFLAYLEETEEPVALLPQKKRKGYELYNPRTGETVPVTQDNCHDVKPIVMMFYVSLPEKSMDFKDLLRFLWKENQKKDFLTITFSGLAVGILSAMIPQMTGVLFNTIIPSGEKALIIQMTSLMLVYTVSTFYLNILKATAVERIEHQTEFILQTAIWSRLLNLNISFHNKYSTGELTECALGISQIRRLVSGTLITMMLEFICSGCYVILLFTQGIPFGLTGLLYLFLLNLTSFVFIAVQLRYEVGVLDMGHKISAQVLEWVKGLTKIKMVDAEKRVFAQWVDKYIPYRELYHKKEMVAIYFNLFYTASPLFMSTYVYFTVSNLSLTMEAGDFFIFQVAMTKLMQSSLSLAKTLIESNAMFPIYKKIAPILLEEPEVERGKEWVDTLEGNLEVSHVCFRYGDGPLILNNVSLQIKKGEHIALVGTSGGGKSTLFRILLGFETPLSGDIFYDHYSLQEVNIKSIRQKIGVVLQNSQLMSGSIFDNLRASNPKLSYEEGLELVKMVGMSGDLEEMPMELHTMITESGSTFSGGQRQRIMLARAMANHPTMMFFDEATSALDNVTQKQVMETVEGLNVTRVTVAHRLSTVEHCDRILVLHQGEIVEEGTYEQLVAEGGLFAEMVARQQA